MVIAFDLTDVFANPGSVFKMVLMSQSEVFSSGCTIWEYRSGGGIHPVDATAVAYLYLEGPKSPKIAEKSSNFMVKG